MTIAPHDIILPLAGAMAALLLIALAWAARKWLDL
jgi:hypothetical protein